MNTQMVNPHSSSYEQDQVIGGGLHSAGGHHEQDEHHEKKSVIKKVKAKAKKIKSTIGSKIHGGHDHEQEQNDPDQDMDEDESDDELEQDQVVHGAPMSESSAVKMGNENLNSGPTHLNVVDKGYTRPAGINFGEEGVPGPKRTDFSMKSSSGPTKVDLHDKAYTGQSRPNLGMSNIGETGLGIPKSPVETDPNTSKDHFGLDLHDKANTGQTRTNLGMSKTGESKTGSGIHAPLESDPNAPEDHFGNITSGNYQSKVNDHTGAGAKEADVEPITRAFRKMEVNNEPGQEPAFPGTGSHGQFSPDSTATKSVPRQGFETKTDNMNVDEKPNRNPSYTEKITSGTYAIAGYAGSALTGTAASAKNVVGSATSTITGTAATAKNAVASKLGYGRNDNSNSATQDTHMTRNEGTHTSDLPNSSTAAVGDHRNPSYTGKITSGTSAIAGYAGSALTGTAASARNVVGYTTSTITGTAVAAKNVVASKLGYGGNDKSNIATQDTHLTRNDGAHTGDQTKSSTAAVGGYGRQVTSTVSEKLAPVYGTVAGVGSAVVTPVYEKVAGAGSAVKSKIQGTGTGTKADAGTGTKADAGTESGTEGVSVTEQDKGGVSVKDYLVQKLSPGDEDKALSEVISGVMNKKKDEFPETVAQNMDRVTDSPEVARSLGTDEHEYRKDGDHQGYGNNGSIGGGVGSPGGTGMVGRVKGVVSSWFGKGTGDQITANEQRFSGGVVGGKKDEGHET